MKKPVSFIGRITERLHDRAVKEWQSLYSKSIALDGNVPEEREITQALAEICAKVGIQTPPELRHIEEGELQSLPAFNCILINDDMLGMPKQLQQGAMAHELSHIVFNETTTITHRAQEKRADRFSHYVMGSPEPFIEFCKQRQKERYKTRNQMMQKGNTGEVAIMDFEDGVSRFTHKSLGSRIIHMQEPLRAYEIKRFEKAVQDYNRGGPNAQVTQGR